MTTCLHLSLHICSHGEGRRNFTWYSTSWVVLISMPYSSLIYPETFLIALAVEVTVPARLKLPHVAAPGLLISHSLSVINLPLQTIFSYALTQGMLYM